MKLLRSLSTPILLGLITNNVQAIESQERVSARVKQSIAAIQYEVSPEQSYLSLNHNRRLTAAQGLSFDTVVPQLSISENTHLSGFARVNEDEQQLSMGLQIGDSKLQVSTGRGLGFSRLSNQYAEVDPYYFHGGSTAAYQFNGVELTRQFGSKANLQIGQAHIHADNLEDRVTHYIGGRTGNVSAHYMQISRGGDKAGEALNLGFESGLGSADWSMLKQAAGGEIQQFSFTFKPIKRNHYRLLFSNRQNPLIDGSDQYRLMIGFSRPLGQFRMSAAESGKSEEDIAKSTSRRNSMIIGGSAVVAALVLSSGSDDQDNTPRLEEQHAAARQALNEINPVSVRINREHGGWIYQTSDGRYTYTRPVQGGVASVNIPGSLIPRGGRPRASYHTHAGPDPRYLNEQFSPADIASDNAIGVDGYLGTPAGNFLYHRSGSNEVIRLGSIAN